MRSMILRKTASWSRPAGVRLTTWRRRSTGIATTLDQLVLLERVEQPDELASVELQRVCDRRLRVTGALLEQREDASGGTG